MKKHRKPRRLAGDGADITAPPNRAAAFAGDNREEGFNPKSSSTRKAGRRDPGGDAGRRVVTSLSKRFS